MPNKIDHFFGEIMHGLSMAQARGDMTSSKFRSEYENHEHLKHYTPPRFLMTDATFNVNYAVAGLEHELPRDDKGNLDPAVKSAIIGNLPRLVRLLISHPPLATVAHRQKRLRPLWKKQGGELVELLKEEVEGFSGKTLEALCGMIARNVIHHLQEITHAHDESLAGKIGLLFGWGGSDPEVDFEELSAGMARLVRDILGENMNMDEMKMGAKFLFTADELSSVDKEKIQTIRFGALSQGSKQE